VDGKFNGVLKTDNKYWEPNNPEKWDWSAGIFTKYFSDILTENKKDYSITTVDISKNALYISKTMTKSNNKNIRFVNCKSEDIIKSYPDKSIDLLYLDTGNMDEFTAKLHLREAQLLINK
jgi:ubiquinone/menaquinone biosynthesis C-methylase UbiE